MKKLLKRPAAVILTVMLLLTIGTCTVFAAEDDFGFDIGLESEPETEVPVCEDHNYITTDVTDGTVTQECEICGDVQSGSIPQYADLCQLYEYSNSGMSYSYSLDSYFNVNEVINVYANSDYADYGELEFFVSNSSILQIAELTDAPENCYSFKFLKEGVVTVAVTSKYDDSVVYDIATFISEGYDTFLNTYNSYTGEKDCSGDIDGNGNVSSSDARLILRIAANLSKCNTATMQYADTNGNGKVTSADARLALRVSAKLDNESTLARFYIIDSSNSYWYSDDTQTLTFNVGDSKTLDYFIIRQTSGNITWTSSNTSVATITQSGKITAVKKGYTYITVTNGTETYNYEVFVLDPKDSIQNYNYNTQLVSLGTGKTYTPEYLVLKDIKNVTWKSSNPSVATVDKNGKITAVKKGYACIIASNGTESYYYEVTVKNELQQKIDKFRTKYPDGYYWNNHTPSKQYPNVSEIPCTDHSTKKYAYCKGQCAGFADLMFREIYGSNAKKNYGVTWKTVEIGDYLRLNPHHSVFVIDVVKKGEIIGYDRYSNTNITADEDYVKVVHCNWGSNCNIIWDDYFSTSRYTLNTSQCYSAQ